LDWLRTDFQRALDQHERRFTQQVFTIATAGEFNIVRGLQRCLPAVLLSDSGLRVH
jgi:hypothetical protein